MWQPGKVLSNKTITDNAYLAATNYWTPLQTDENEEDEETEEANKINNNQIPKSNKWERRLARRIEKRMVIDSGATTHFFVVKKWTYQRKENQTRQFISPMETSFERQSEHPYLFNNSAREQEKHMHSHSYDNH